jgi:hypothetical protein
MSEIITPAPHHIQPSTIEGPDKAAQEKLRGMALIKQLGHSALAFTVGQITGVPVEANDIKNNFTVTSSTTKLIAESSSKAAQGWQGKSPQEKITSPIRGSLSWANLVLGESIALAAQGAVQTQDASNTKSLLTGIGAALIVDTAFTVPKALENQEKQPPERVAEAAAEAFWLGGAMGVENKKLPLSQAPAAIGAYMLFGSSLAVAAEYDNIAEKMLENSHTVLPLLVGWGVIKKVNEKVGYKGSLDRLADKTVQKVRSIKKADPKD